MELNLTLQIESELETTHVFHNNSDNNINSINARGSICTYNGVEYLEVSRSNHFKSG